MPEIVGPEGIHDC